MQSNSLQLSRLISYLLHPLLIPTFAILVLMQLPGLSVMILPAALKFWLLMLVVVFTILIPSASVFLLMKLNVISSIELSHRNERTHPLVISSVSFTVLAYFMKSANIPPLFIFVIYSATISLLAGLLINSFYKISLHTLGWGSVFAMLVIISINTGIPLPGLISTVTLLAGLVGYARLKENAHNQTQVYMGYIAGVSVVIILIKLLL